MPIFRPPTVTLLSERGRGPAWRLPLLWAMSEKLHEVYNSFRWENWVADVKHLSGDQAINIYPFLWAKGPPIKERHRGAVPVAEQWALQVDLQRQLDGHGGLTKRYSRPGRLKSLRGVKSTQPARRLNAGVRRKRATA